MPGEKNLVLLCQNMAPMLHPGVFVYCCVPHDSLPLQAAPVFSFREVEGVTVIFEKEKADELKLGYQHEFAMITLAVHSALDAVGFIAAFSNELARRDISCNVVSAFHHDHLFVPFDQRCRAMKALEAIASQK